MPKTYIRISATEMREEHTLMMPVTNARKIGNGCPVSVPFEFLNREKAYSFHGQTLERLAQRGGLSLNEVLYNIGEIEYKNHKEHFSRVPLLLNRLLAYCQSLPVFPVPSSLQHLAIGESALCEIKTVWIETPFGEQEATYLTPIITE